MQRGTRLGVAATHAPSSEAARGRADIIVASVLAVAGVLFLFHVFALCRHGLDFTDEGYYLNSIADPWLYRSSVTQFGLVYHPIFRLVGEDVALLRQCNLALTWLLSLTVAWFCVDGERAHRSAMLFKTAVAACLAGTSLLYLSLFWLPTPSYNSLTLQGLLIVALGLAIAHDVQSTGMFGVFTKRRVPIAASLIGIGGAIVFLAKPPSAALLSLVILPVIVLVFWRRWRAVGLAAAVALAVLFTVGLILDGGVPSFISRYRRGMEFSALIAPVRAFSEMLRFEELGIPEDQQYRFQLIAVGTFAMLLVTRTKWRVIASWLLRLLALGGGLGAISFIVKPDLLRFLPQPPQFSYFNVVIGPPLLGVAAFAIMFSWRRAASLKSASSLLVAVFFIACPYVYAFGTGNRVTTQAVGALVFWPLAAALLVRRVRSQDAQRYGLLLVAMVVVPVTTWLVSNSMQHPYRQNAPLPLQIEPVRVGRSQAAMLLVDAETAEYLRELRASVPGGAERLRGAPMLDFTGAHPAALFALGAKAIALPWLIGGYSGSAEMVDRALAEMPCEILAQAWLLKSPNAPRAIPDWLLARHGLDNHEPAVGSFAGPSRENKSKQQLLPPVADKTGAVARCTKFRR